MKNSILGWGLIMRKVTKKRKMKLGINLIPKSSWYKNLRSEFSKKRWDVLRKECYKKANYICEACGGKGDKWPVECHEVWDFSKIGIQKLIRLIALCPLCHKCQHPGCTEWCYC